MNARMQWCVARIVLSRDVCGRRVRRSAAATSPRSAPTRTGCARASRDEECDDAAMCQCGACTSQCSGDMDCAALGSAHCAQRRRSGGAAVCTADALGSAAGICLPSCEPGGCKEAQACVGGLMRARARARRRVLRAGANPAQRRAHARRRVARTAAGQMRTQRRRNVRQHAAARAAFRSASRVRRARARRRHGQDAQRSA